MSDLIVEVDEAMKQEKLEKLWQNYGGFFMGLLAMLILGTAANAGYDHWKSKKNIAQTDLYLDALIDEEDTSESLQKIGDKIENPDLRAITQIHAAGRALKQGQTEKAIELYPTNEDLPPALKGLSQLMSITKNTQLSTQEKTDKIAPLLKEENNPWRYHAYLEMALISANENNDYISAQQYLKHIIDAENIPQTLKKKAQSLDILYALKGSQK